MTTAPRLTIDLAALADNWKHLSDKSANAETAAVVKANAYGIGIEQAVPVLRDAGCTTFFTAMVEEALQVRQVLPHARIFILNGIFKDTIVDAIENNLSPVLSTPEQVELWSTFATGHPSAIHIDTGMNRLGLTLGEAEQLANDLERMKTSGATTIMSHLACADDPEHPQNKEQLERFDTISGHFDGLERSFANSAAILGLPNTNFDLTRPGIAMYGGEALNDVANPMKPVVKAETRILQIREAKAGEAVGYGAASVLTRDTKIAICSAGYADGYHRASSGSGIPLRNSNTKGGNGILAGTKVPILGRVSMDLTAFDVTNIEQAKPGDLIELFGPNIALDDAARAAGTIGYELLTGLGQRYIREYIE